MYVVLEINTNEKINLLIFLSLVFKPLYNLTATAMHNNDLKERTSFSFDSAFVGLRRIDSVIL